MLFLGTMYLEAKLFLLIIFCNGTFLISNIFIVFNTNACIYVYIRVYIYIYIFVFLTAWANGWGVALIEVSLFKGHKFSSLCFVCVCICFSPYFTPVHFIIGLWTGQ
jgi:hypothetical protein